MDLSTEKQRPQLVEVINQNGTSENPQKAEVVNLPMSPGGSIQTYIQGGTLNTISALRPVSSANYNVCLDNILLLQGDGTFVPIPLCTMLTNISSSQLTNCLASYKTAYSNLVSGVTAATLHYSKMTNTGTITSEVYNLKD